MFTGKNPPAEGEKHCSPPLGVIVVHACGQAGRSSSHLNKINSLVLQFSSSCTAAYINEGHRPGQMLGGWEVTKQNFCAAPNDWFFVITKTIGFTISFLVRTTWDPLVLGSTPDFGLRLASPTPVCVAKSCVHVCRGWPVPPFNEGGPDLYPRHVRMCS